MSILSKEEVVAEVIKAGKNPTYFINNYAKISHPQRGLIPFKTYDFQSDLIDTFQDNRFTVVLKARQLGISTISAAYIAWLMLFHRDKNVLVIATKFQTAANLVKKVKAIHKHLPPWLRISNISIDNLPYTNEETALGLIYIVRDPRDIAVSYSHHKSANIDAVINLMLDESVIYNENSPQILSNWNHHYNSWLSLKVPIERWMV